jgi:TRAP-type C4-dicarboxylate transport system permease small subunit
MTPPLARLDRMVGVSLKAVMIASFSALFAMIAWVVATRILGLRSAGWTDELIELLFAWMLFTGAASLWRDKAHFAVDLLVQTVRSARVRRALALTSEVLCLIFLVVFVYEAVVLIHVNSSETSPVFGLPRIWWFGVMPLTGSIMIAYSIVRISLNLQGREFQPHDR